MNDEETFQLIISFFDTASKGVWSNYVDTGKFVIDVNGVMMEEYRELVKNKVLVVVKLKGSLEYFILTFLITCGTKAFQGTRGR